MRGEEKSDEDLGWVTPLITASAAGQSQTALQPRPSQPIGTLQQGMPNREVGIITFHKSGLKHRKVSFNLNPDHFEYQEKPF